MFAERVFHGELVEPELLGQRVEIFLGRAGEIDPHDDVAQCQLIRDGADREVLFDEDALAVRACSAFAHTTSMCSAATSACQSVRISVTWNPNAVLIASIGSFENALPVRTI